MTHHPESDLLNTVLQLITEQGPAGLSEGIRPLVNEAMPIERSHALQAPPYERTEVRKGPANGFKEKPSPPTSTPSPSTSPTSAGR